jgi:NADH:ubiquinone oxidoreductase subunit F (NADH-binding)/(2Fe-2S) ferredoxin/NAD-dependent dihydropyrimidine dehydrogenase PreA subunit
MAVKPGEMIIGMGTCGIASGADKIYDLAKELLKKKAPSFRLKPTGCIGMCHMEVLVDVALEGRARVTYGEIDEERLSRIIESHTLKGRPVKDLAIAQMTEYGKPYKGIPLFEETGYMNKQKRLVLSNCGHIDPTSIDEYIQRGGYVAAEKVITSMTPDEVIAEVTASGQRGRGGAGFPTGIKWNFCNKAPADQKYIICNADEGDPGAFMDRSVLEGDPHAVIEGMIIAGYSIGATKGYIYCRAEYPLALKILRTAIKQAAKRGIIGKNIFNSAFDFQITIKEGAGAFVCGEETALIASIEGKRGMPRTRPPFPAQKGLWGRPTTINNVETLANIPRILLKGADWFASHGTEKSKGTKVFALAGKIVRPGLIEIPMGLSLREVIYDIGGGLPEGRTFKAVQTGGPSGGCIPSTLVDISVDYESLAKVGSIVGSGGMIVMDETTCMVDMSKYFLQFTQAESCGKCTPCRIGTKQMLEVLTRITEGKGAEGDLEMLENLGKQVKSTSLCGLGKTVPNPVLTTMKYFREEYEAHIRDRRCPALACEALLSYYIMADKCRGCGICFRACPSEAIKGGKKLVHIVDQDKCIRCGTCLEVCPAKFGAVLKVSGESIETPEEPVPVSASIKKKGA